MKFTQNKTKFLIAAFSWALMLNSSIRAYQLESITIVAALLSLTPILNSLAELIINKNKERIIQKIIIFPSGIFCRTAMNIKRACKKFACSDTIKTNYFLSHK